ncbi:uncharacterized protein CELE_F59A7.5 [Caenorhabditis elegans]|uniref:Secreted protein n=1 Tax=Caenorhabditis elegans TaxID=6239 RepID=A0A0K3AVN2_CAEEL|nr:Secreted protein [Caenorhabditis elegans]CTQ86822.1 Secreted protein [Caenorhabditis elegans]|eukprot:NP_001300123.1 Uncharacterized protein CELE_F59A7.5 [Caenorhabditis elegans]
MRQIATAICLFLVVLTKHSIGAQNDTLEMELESNITVVKLEHGLKFQAHSEFGLPDNMTDLFNSTAADSEGANNSSVLEAPRVKRSNKNASSSGSEENDQKDGQEDHHRKKKGATKKKVTTKKKKVTTKKPKKTTKKKLTTKKLATTTTRSTTKHRQFPDQKYLKKSISIDTKLRDSSNFESFSSWIFSLFMGFSRFSVNTTRPPLQPVTEQKPGYPDDRHQTTTRRKFVMYDDEEKEAEKKDPEKEDKFNDSNSNWRSWKN